MQQANFSMDSKLEDSKLEDSKLEDENASRYILQIENVRGLHARASAKFVKCAEKFDADITVTCKGQSVPGTSIMGLMMLGACPGSQIEVLASGPDHRQALSALILLVKGKFGEE